MAQARPASVRQSSVSSSQRAPFERLLDRRLQSVSTFVSSTDTQSEGGGASGSGGKPQKVGTANSARWSEEMPQAVLFPANKPTSRADAAILDKWITSSFASYAQRSATEDGKEIDLIKTVEELVPVLSIGLHELVRQVTQHCLERGVVLEKIWRTYVELFERALGETRASLRRHKQRTARVEAELQRTRAELSELQEKHPVQIAKLSNTLEGKFAQRQDEILEQLRIVNQENKVLQEHLKEQSNSVGTWFPLFSKYQDSRYRLQLSHAPALNAAGTSAEARLAADFKRILATMPSDGRRRVGFFISSLLGLRGTQATFETVEGLSERKVHNEWKIKQLEARLKQLKGLE
mmetsp:Transcript_44187/g.140761  ORF Transcript_44187/g.140761 Transcript_44187/m.140761 type:complete len:350 (-) Transcript_44187:57-1106(-)